MIGNALLLPFSILFLAVRVNFVAMSTSRLVGGNQRLQLLRHLDYLEKEQIRDAEETLTLTGFNCMICSSQCTSLIR